MTEPSSNVPEDLANADVEAEGATSEPESPVELNIDQEKREAWDRIKTDYETEPRGEPVPNSMDTAQSDLAEAEDSD